MTSEVRPNYSLKAKERLKSKKEIEELFKKSSSFFVKPILLKYVIHDEPGENKVLVVVPKKHHKKAVARNLLKRRIREAYRQNKHKLASDKQHIHLAFLFLSADTLSFHEIQEKLITLMQRLEQRLS
ncbi:MAG: ribonuclease P protein component [Cytophagales bacterium]|nr:ribonuclease P protein component [Cytophagales bacterium]